LKSVKDSNGMLILKLVMTLPFRNTLKWFSINGSSCCCGHENGRVSRWSFSWKCWFDLRVWVKPSLAFQLQDDYLDAFVTRNFGKRVGGDNWE
jgi:hypothetical protein